MRTQSSSLGSNLICQSRQKRLCWRQGHDTRAQSTVRFGVRCFITSMYLDSTVMRAQTALGRLRYICPRPGAGRRGVSTQSSEPLLSLPPHPSFFRRVGRLPDWQPTALHPHSAVVSISIASCILSTPLYVALTTNIYPGKIKLCHKAILSLVPHRPPLLPR
jgi:hypothetical protein